MLEQYSTPESKKASFDFETDLEKTDIPSLKWLQEYGKDMSGEEFISRK